MINVIENHFLRKLMDAFIGKGSFMLFSLSFTLISTRLFGIENFGEYTFSYTFVSVLMIFSKVGLDSGLMYSMPKTGNKFISLSLLVNFIVSFIVIFLTAFLVDDSYLRFMLPLTWLLSLEQVFFGIYRAQGEIKEFYFINGFLSMILRLVLLVIAFNIFGATPYSISISVYLSVLFSNIYYLVQNKYKIKKVEFDKKFLLYSVPLVLSNLLGILMGKTDILMLGFLSNIENVGIYQVVVQVTNLISMLLIIFSTVFAPEISRFYHQKNFEGIRILYIKATRVLSSIGIITTLILITFSNSILNIFSNDAVTGSTALVFLALGQLINISVGSVWTMMAMTGKPAFQLYANILAISANIALNFILIPSFGMGGAAFASMITHFITNLLGYISVSRRFKVRVFKLF